MRESSLSGVGHAPRSRRAWRAWRAWRRRTATASGTFCARRRCLFSLSRLALMDVCFAGWPGLVSNSFPAYVPPTAALVSVRSLLAVCRHLSSLTLVVAGDAVDTRAPKKGPGRATIRSWLEFRKHFETSTAYSSCLEDVLNIFRN